jgi:hypothetical protein
MNLLYKYRLFFIAFFVFSQCKSSKDSVKISNEMSIVTKDYSVVYFENWIAGIQGGGSGTNLFVSKSILNNKKLISAYFRGKVTDFEVLKPSSNFYIARFKGVANLKRDLNMDNDIIKEYGNKSPMTSLHFPFELLNDEAVISYLENDIIMYMKLTNISQKESIPYPSAPRN